MPKQNEISEEYKILLRQIGVNLARARKERGLTQRNLAEQCEKNQTLIAKLEKYAPNDMSMRSIYEIVRHIPMSFSEFIAKAERDLELESIPRNETTVAKRLQILVAKLQDLSASEQAWMADMIEGLLFRTHTLPDRCDKPDPKLESPAAQPN